MKVKCFTIIMQYVTTATLTRFLSLRVIIYNSIYSKSLSFISGVSLTHLALSFSFMYCYACLSFILFLKVIFVWGCSSRTHEMITCVKEYAEWCTCTCMHKKRYNVQMGKYQIPKLLCLCSLRLASFKTIMSICLAINLL